MNAIEMEQHSRNNQASMELKVYKMEMNAKFEKYEKTLFEVKHTLSHISIGHYACKRELKEINSEISQIGKVNNGKHGTGGGQGTGHKSTDALFSSQGFRHNHDHHHHGHNSQPTIMDERSKLSRLEIKLDTLEKDLKLKKTDFDSFKEEMEQKLSEKADDLQMQMLDESTTFRLNEIIRKFFK